MTETEGRTPPVILYDDTCRLCDAWAKRIGARDARGEFRFAALGSEEGRAALAARGGPAAPDSVVLVDERGVHTRSDAVLRIGRRLGYPGWLISVLTRVPRPVRDALYAMVARHRHGWFGRREARARPGAGAGDQK